MRYSTIGTTVGAGLLLLLTACGGGETGGGTDPTTSTPTTTTTSPTSTEAETPAVSPAEVPPIPSGVNTDKPSAEGADAGPGAKPFYNGSQTAYTNFVAWWAYEFQVQQDFNVPADKIYGAGIAVCGSRYQHAGTDAILTVIERDMGFTKAGAAGIYRAALEALCPEYNLGYKTYFDSNVDTMIAALSGKIVFKVMPPAYQFGYFMKETCAALVQFGGSGLWNHMVGMGTQLDLMEGGTVTEQELRMYIKAAVSSGCSSLTTQLPPVILMVY